MFELTGNARQTRDSRAPSPKLRTDGTNYPYRMFFDSNSRIVDAETLPELIEQLIPGYLEADDFIRSRMRKEHAAGTAFTVRASILGGLTVEDEKKLNEWEWEVLSSDEPLHKIYPLALIPEDDDEEEEDESIVGKLWESDVPLVLAEESFHPFTPVLPPLSVHGDAKHVPNIIWLRSSTEESFLDSLANIGVISYGSPRVEPTAALR